MKKALTPTQMAISDRLTIESGIASVELMRRVAQAVFDSLEWQGSVAIICGKGNNGGDGLALACIMVDKGIYPHVFLIGDLSADGRYYYDELQSKGYDKIYSIQDCGFSYDIIVDCIFGTGFKGQPKQEYADIIEKINASKAFKLSIDIPSGLDGYNGRYANCINANKTITVQYPKIGLYLNDGKDMTGELSVIDVGIGLYSDCINIVEEQDVAILFPKRKNNTHKGTFGKSGILGGCGNYLGAVKLANMGLCALRSGGGLNVIITPQCHVDNILGCVMESTVIGMPDDGGYFVFDKDSIEKALQGIDCLAIGMGMGNRYVENARIIEYIVTKYSINVIIDADGLNSLATNVDMLKCAKANIILTPHVKEMSRLCGRSVEDILDDPIGVAMSFAKEYGVVVLLKGASSVITDGEEVYITTNGGAELSKGGSGDTLSGVMLGMLSQGIPLIESAYSSAFLTARVAKGLVDEFSEYGVLPSDVARVIRSIVATKS